jgi:phosphatidylserine/phosphatidylglycerophosphate/cardiolipin synthase-like enzyme
MKNASLASGRSIYDNRPAPLRWNHPFRLATRLKESARVLVLSAIDSAKTSWMMAYSFTAPDIMKALVAAKKRGVDVKIVIDERGNTGRASIAAMNYIANSGIPLRTDSVSLSSMTR